MIPSTFTLTGARTVTYDDGVRALIFDGVQQMLLGHSLPVSVTVFLGDDDMAQEIIDALGGAA